MLIVSNFHFYSYRSLPIVSFEIRNLTVYKIVLIKLNTDCF